MASLLGRKIEFTVVPTKLFKKSIRTDWNALLSLDDCINLDGAPNSSIRIEVRENYSVPPPYGSRLLDTSKVIAIYLNVNRDNIRHYLDISHSIIQSKFKEHGITNRSASYNREKIRSIIFSGEIQREFHRIAYTMLLAIHIAKPLSVQVGRIVHGHLSGTLTSEQFHINLMNRDATLDDVSIRGLNPKDTFEFISNVIGEKEKNGSQFVRGISYLSQVFRAGPESPMVTFMWSIAAIEAMLSTSSDKANSGILEARLKAVLGNDCDDALVGRFRKTYRYRNAILHGNVLLPLSFDPANPIGFAGVEHSQILPYDQAAFAYAIAIKLLQRFVEMKRHDFKYTTVLAPV